MTRFWWLIACVLASAAAGPHAAEAALEGEWLGSFAQARLCGGPATVTDFRLRITSAPWLKVPAEQFRYARADISGPASIRIASSDPAIAPFVISGEFLGGLVAGAPEPTLTGYFVSAEDYATWRQRKPFSPPTGAIEARLTVHGDWASHQSLSGTLRSLARCAHPAVAAARSQPSDAGPETGVPHVMLEGALTRQ